MTNSESQHESALSDGIAVGLSVMCIVHCLFLPFVVGLMPLLGAVTHAPWVHAVLLGLATPLSIWVLGGGYVRHKKIMPPIIGAVGLVLLALGMLHNEHLPSERAMSVVGALILAGAHGYNYFLRWRRTR